MRRHISVGPRRGVTWQAGTAAIAPNPALPLHCTGKRAVQPDTALPGKASFQTMGQTGSVMTSCRRDAPIFFVIDATLPPSCVRVACREGRGKRTQTSPDGIATALRRRTAWRSGAARGEGNGPTWPSNYFEHAHVFAVTAFVPTRPGIEPDANHRRPCNFRHAYLSFTGAGTGSDRTTATDDFRIGPGGASESLRQKLSRMGFCERENHRRDAAAICRFRKGSRFAGIDGRPGVPRRACPRRNLAWTGVSAPWNGNNHRQDEPLTT